VRDRAEAERLPALIATQRAGLALVTGDLDGTISGAERAVAVAGTDDLLTLAAARALKGLASWAVGDLQSAYEAYTAAAHDLAAAGHVADVSLELEEGEILGLIGPNGAGKTTLVNLITGTAPGWTGEIRFRGRSLQRLRPYRIGRLGIARSFQIAQPFGAVSLVENVMVGALYGQGRRVHLRAARAASLEILESLGLAEKADLLAESLNAAERKRLEIAKALSIRDVFAVKAHDDLPFQVGPLCAVAIHSRFYEMV
jgi:ABC-type lipopolysaccharide export system ATPase subunit